jgi:hypothetical protein
MVDAIICIPSFPNKYCAYKFKPKEGILYILAPHDFNSNILIDKMNPILSQ